MENKIENLSRNKFYWLYLAGIFLILVLPLANLPPWFSPPDWGKTIVFRIVMSVLIFFFAWQTIFKKSEVFHSKGKFLSKSLIFWLLTALLFIFFLSALFSLDRNFSLWGDPYRSGGFINFASYIIFAILAFLLLQKSGWQKILNFAIFIGVLVSVVAIFQQFGILSKIFLPRATALTSTIGGPISLGIYLLLLSFLTLSFGLNKRGLKSKIFYFLSFCLFFSVILLTTSQASYLGFAIGFLFFLFFYPVRSKLSKTSTPPITGTSNGVNPRKILWLKLTAGILLILGVFGIYFLKTHPEISLNKNYVIQAATSWRVDQSRISSWKISLKAIKEKPLFGFGPENFSIGFDKYYDPSLPLIQKDPYMHTSWWDRAHNFIFEIGVTAGIPALIIYLFLFGVLFWQLQKLKYNTNPAPEQSSVRGKSTNDAVIVHGLQATFIGYLVANFFSFDTFSSYLILFLLVAFSLFLLYNPNSEIETIGIERKNNPGIQKYKLPVLIIIIGILSWFIWIYNIRPFLINTQINIAENLANNKLYDAALLRLEKQFKNHSILDHYLRLGYGDIIGEHIYDKPELAGILAEKAKKALLENTKIRPYYTRDWLLLGTYTNILIEKETDPVVKNKLKEEVNYYLEKASELSPKKQEVFIERINTDLLTADYQKAKGRAQKCIDLNSNLDECWWMMGLTNIYLNENEDAKKNIQIASQKGHDVDSKNSVLQLIRAYGEKKDWQKVIENYLKLINFDPENPQYHATLAFLYKEVGDYQKAEEQALKVLKLSPENKTQVEEFLKSLK